MKTGRSGPRSQNGCWTCRGRKVKCEESRPVCKNCGDRGLDCDYAPRLKPQRRRRRTGTSENGVTEVVVSPSKASQYVSSTSVQSPSIAASSPTLLRPAYVAQELPLELPNGICIQDWPIPLSSIDCQALQHYAQNFISRMVLRTPKWSSYTFILFLCSKHPLLAHLVLAFSVRDMASHDGGPLHIIAIEHYRTALALFIQLLGASEQHLWLAFPALWLFIHYEQQYGNDPRALQRHLVGVRDVVASHGTALFLTLDGEFSTMDMAGTARPRQIVDRLALWAIYHDASAATFGFSGGLIRLLNEQYPGSIAKIRESSKSMIGAAWGEIYPVEEKLWDVQLSPMEDLYHECHLLRYELSRVGKENDEFSNNKLIEIGGELKRLEREHLPLLEAALSCRMERNTIQSNNYAGAAIYFALVTIYERMVFSTRPTVAISKTLRACSKLYEHEGADYLWRIAWPMFVAGLETDDLIYQTWVIERFTSMQSLGENLRRAKVLLESICAEQQKTGQQIDFLSRIREGHFLGFVI